MIPTTIIWALILALFGFTAEDRVNKEETQS